MFGEDERKKSEIDAEIELDVIETNTVPLDTGGGVKVLSEKTESDDNFYNDKLGPWSILINPPIWVAQEPQIRFKTHYPFPI